MVRPPAAVVHCGRRRAGGAGIPEVGHAAAFAIRTDHHGDAIGAGDGSLGHVDIEAVLGEEPTGGRWVLGLAPRLDAFFFESLLERPGPIGVVAVDGGSLVGDDLVTDREVVGLLTVRDVPAALNISEEIGDELFGHTGVAGIAGGHDGLGDDL